MKFLVCSDIHGEEEALLRLKKVASAEKADHVLICGDISRTVSFAEEALSAFPGCYVVPGNWDSEAVNGVLAGHPGYVHGKRFELGDGLNLVGFGYSPITPFGTYGELEDGEIYERMKNLPIDGNTLLMLHCPPMGHFDSVPTPQRNAGSSGILRILRERKPLAAFFGHIHEHSGTEMLGNTLLVKVPAANSMGGCLVEMMGKDYADDSMNGCIAEINRRKFSVRFITL